MLSRVTVIEKKDRRLMSKVLGHKPYKFDSEQGQWIQYLKNNTNSEQEEIKKLKILTYNVLFDEYQADQIYSEERWPRIFKVLEESDCDIIGLQEVKFNFLQALVKQEFIKKKYFISDVTKETIQNYGQVLLSKYPIVNQFAMRFAGGMKMCLFASVQVNKHLLNFAVIHLTSDKSTDPQKKRQRQLEEIFSFLYNISTFDENKKAEQKKAQKRGKVKNLEKVEPKEDFSEGKASNLESFFVIGDFNFGDEAENEKTNFYRFKDLWKIMLPTLLSSQLSLSETAKAHFAGGFTFDPSCNTMADVTSLTKNKRRLDRILIDSVKIVEKDVTFVGTEGFLVKSLSSKIQLEKEGKEEVKEVLVYPSDHFGLLGIFEFKE